VPIDINRIKTLVRDCTLFAVKAKVSSVSESIRYITCGRYSVAIRKDETFAEKNANDLLLRFFHENGLNGCLAIDVAEKALGSRDLAVRLFGLGAFIGLWRVSQSISADPTEKDLLKDYLLASI